MSLENVEVSILRKSNLRSAEFSGITEILASSAMEIGLINQVCPVEEVLPKAMAVARQIAANSPLAVRLTKQLAVEKRFERWGSQETDERYAASLARNGPDIKKGLTAFLNKSLPSY